MLQSEFFIQGDREKYHKFPVTAMFDRELPSTMATTQAQFFKIIAMPMFEILFGAFPSAIAPIHDNIERNCEYWQNYYEAHRVHRRSSVNLHLDNHRDANTSIRRKNTHDSRDIRDIRDNRNFPKDIHEEDVERRTSNASNASHATCASHATNATNATFATGISFTTFEHEKH